MSLDREALLGKHFNLQGGDVLPGGILAKSKRIVEANLGGGIIVTPGAGNRGEVAAVERAEKQVIGHVFQDDRINLRQRESIAKAILAGDYTVGEARAARGDAALLSPHLAAVRDLDVTRGEGLLRRHGMKKPRFLQIVSAPAPVLVATASAVLQHEQQKRRSKAKKTGFFLFNQYLPEEERPIYAERGCGTLEHSDYLDQRASMLQQSKLDVVKRCKEEAALCKELAAREKRRDQDAKEKKHQLRNQIRDFRQLVLQRLTERADPLQGKIMRALTDKTARALMEQYRGFTMTVDAIITLLGTSLGRDIGRSAEASGPAQNVRVAARAESVSQSMEKALESRACYSNEYPLEGRKFGSRAASRTRPISPPPAMDEAGASNTRAPSRSMSPSWNAPSPSLRRRGSGFTILPRTDRVNSRGGQDNVVSEDPQDLLFMNDSFGSGEDAVAQRAIASVMDEMRGDGTLPSLQPERVISDTQLERLGTNEATFDSIAREVRYQKNKKMQKEQADRIQTMNLTPSSQEVDIEMGFLPKDQVERITNPGDLHFPKALKTAPSSEPTPPYKSYHEKQLVIAQGIAAGSGLALWTGPRKAGVSPSFRPKSSPGSGNKIPNSRNLQMLS